ncbi:MAG: hypothetical protein HRF43_12070 [Phycisphaerae bacterium]
MADRRSAGPAPAWPRAGTRGGLALFELVVVMVILALMGAIAAPRVSNLLRRQRLDLASRRLMADLGLVRNMAIRDQADRKMVLSTVGGFYSLPEYLVAGAAYRVQFNTAPFEGVQLRSVSYAPTEVVFNRLGLPQAGGTIVLGDGVERVNVSLSAASGRATRTFQAGP